MPGKLNLNLNPLKKKAEPHSGLPNLSKKNTIAEKADQLFEKHREEKATLSKKAEFDV